MTARRPTQHDKTPAKTPRRAARAARSKGETREAPAKRRTTAYPAKVKDAALEQLAADGMAATHRATGVPKATLTRWARAAGIELDEQARRRTAAATEAVRARAAEVRLTTVELLEEHVAQAGHYLTQVAGANALAADLIAGIDPDLLKVEQGIAGPYVVVEDPTAQAAQKRAMALAGLPLAPRDAEGLLTRAIHDLQLLKGEATERGELVVEFTVPRPSPGGAVPVEQDALGIEAP